MPFWFINHASQIYPLDNRSRYITDDRSLSFSMISRPEQSTELESLGSFFSSEIIAVSQLVSNGGSDLEEDREQRPDPARALRGTFGDLSGYLCSQVFLALVARNTCPTNVGIVCSGASTSRRTSRRVIILPAKQGVRLGRENVGHDAGLRREIRGVFEELG